MTEEVSDQFMDLDLWSTRKAAQAMYDGQAQAIHAIEPALDDIAAAVDAAASRLRGGGRLVYVGAGTSGRLAVQDGAELGPTFGWPQERIVFCIAGGLAALTISAEGAEDITGDGKAIIADNGVTDKDVVICVAASGRTPYTLGALEAAKALGALTIGIVNNANTPIAVRPDHSIVAQTGSEIVAGSTRMKAGTAQKAILNIVSTAIMMRLGHVYNGYMVDMVVSNAKLETRAENMVRDIAGCTPQRAASALKQADFNIKLGVMIACGTSQKQGQDILTAEGGNLRQALSRLDAHPGGSAYEAR